MVFLHVYVPDPDPAEYPHSIDNCDTAVVVSCCCCFDGHIDLPTTAALKAALPWQKKINLSGISSRVMYITHCAYIQHFYGKKKAIINGSVP